MSDNSIVCEDCMSRANEAKWRERAVTAEMELKQYIHDVQRQHEQLSVLARERDDLQVQLRDTQIRNDVLKSRLDRMISADITNRCPPSMAKLSAKECGVLHNDDCKACWHKWLEQEVQA